MLKRGANKSNHSLKLILSIVSLVTALTIQLVPSSVFAATLLLNRADRLSTSQISAPATHNISFTITDLSTAVGSILIEFCANNPTPGDVCVPPSGFDATATGLTSQSGETGFGIHANSNANRIILTRTAAVPTVANVNYVFSSITNPSTLGTFFARLQTFTADDATGTDIQSGGIALSTTDTFMVSTEVPPFLRFCASVTIVGFDCSTANSFLIDLGEFSETQTKFAQAEMMAVTNAASGLSISISGTTLTSGNNTITPLMPQASSSAGASQFGINLRANTSPGIGADAIGPGIATPSAAYNTPNQFRFQSGDVVASSTGPNDYRKFTISYIANIDNAQPPGVYATTISFICLANF